ncbi:MAG: glycosyltransferase family 4 protein [Oligoflexia bacterium]|nr:glycosyltransferase family 4 protein [Oligoflexia bacterium]
MSNNLKVLHITPTYFSTESVLGGAERYVDGLASEMGEFCKCDVLSFGNENKTLEMGNYNLIIKKKLTNINNSLINPLHFSFVKEFLKYDVLHCHQYHTFITEFTLLANKLLKKMVFVTDHGGGGRTFLRTLKLTNSKTKILAVSKYSLNKLGGAGTVIYGGINKNFKKINTKKINNLIVSVGRILPHKGFHHLINAITNQELVIVGSQASKGYLEDIKKLSSGKNITFIENLNDKDVCNLLNQAQFAVYPSTYFGINNKLLSGEPELFGQAPLEAMACGTAALISNVGSYPEIALPNKQELSFTDANFIELKEKINFLTSNYDQCLLLGELALEHSQKFNWRQTVENCFKAYLGKV